MNWIKRLFSKKARSKQCDIHGVSNFEIKVKHGMFVKEPKCKICKITLTHDWLGGDYTLLMCDDKNCWEKLNKQEPLI